MLAGKRAWWLLWVLLLSEAALADSGDAWRRIRYGALKVGRVRISREKTTREGRTLYRTDVVKVYNYFQGKNVRFSSQETFLEAEDGSLVEISYTGQSDAGKKTVLGEIAEGKIVYVVKDPGGSPRQMEIDWPAGVIGPRAVERLMRSKGTAPGTSYDYTTYSFAVSRPVKVSVEAVRREAVRVAGRKRQLHLLKVAGEDLVDGQGKPIGRKRWVDDRGDFQMEWDPCFGGRWEEVCGEDLAKAPARGVVSKFFLGNACKISGAILHPRSTTACVFHLTGPEALNKFFLKGPGQRVGRAGGGYRIDVRLQEAPASPARLPVADESKKSLLQASYFLDYDQGEVEAVARRVAGGGTDAARVAEALRAWVYENLEKLGMNSAMACASTVLATKAGSPVGHAVLLAALCRAVGIPARVAGGLAVGSGAYTHVWTEAWVGSWIPLDATQKTAADASRIRFTASDLNRDSADAPLFALCGLLQNRQTPTAVEVRQYRLKGKTIEADDGPGSEVHRIRGNAYSHALYGFSFTRPPAFKFQQHLKGIDYGVIAIKGKRKDRVLFRISSVDYGNTLDDVLDRVRNTFRLSGVERRTVGGFPAVVANLSGGFCSRVCYVRGHDTVYTIEASTGSPAVRAAFDQVLDTLRFED